jgi:hypothetical protein
VNLLKEGNQRPLTSKQSVVLNLTRALDGRPFDCEQQP